MTIIYPEIAISPAQEENKTHNDKYLDLQITNRTTD